MLRGKPSVSKGVERNKFYTKTIQVKSTSTGFEIYIKYDLLFIYLNEDKKKIGT